MKTNLYLHIAINIIVLCCVGMFWTFIPPYLRDFFGDTPCNRRYCGDYDDQWIWGARHYWFNIMMTLLFILSLFSSIMSIGNAIKKNYPKAEF